MSHHHHQIPHPKILTTRPTHQVTDPTAPSIHETSGPVASDSLAASSSTYQHDNRNGAALGVSGSNSTFANTSTANADTLPAAPDASSRLSDADRAGTTYTTQDKATAVTDTSGSATTAGASSAAGVAPSYVSAPRAAAAAEGPKGKNLTEGGFESDDSKNASWSTDVGGSGDPGRAAEQRFAKEAAVRDGAANGLPAQTAKTGGNQFERLRAEQAV